VQIQQQAGGAGGQQHLIGPRGQGDQGTVQIQKQGRLVQMESVIHVSFLDNP
jgi:hypothetical protein